MPDLRNTHKGGWSYVEHELYSVFVPLLEPLGGMVYAAMARLIPRADVDADFSVTITSVQQESCVRRSTTGEKMKEIVALGMVAERKNRVANRPSTYTLVPLRELALVGIDELERRLYLEIGWKDFRRRLFERLDEDELQARFGVHWVDIAEEQVFPNAHGNGAAKDAQALSAAAARVGDGDQVREPVPTPPAGSGGNGVHPTDTAPIVGQRRQIEAGTSSVSTTEASVSTTEASVFAQGGHRTIAIRKEEEEEDKYRSTPVVPVPGTAPMLLEREYVDCRPGDPEFEANLGLAARDVLRAWRVSNSRLLHQMRNALRLYATELAEQQDGPTLRVAAELAIERFAEYQEAQTSGLLRFYELPKDFMGNGTWLRPGSWPMDRRALEELRLRRAANVGVRESAEETPLERVWNAVVAGVRRRTRRADGQTSREWAAFATSLLPARLVGVKLDRETRCETWTLQVSDAAGIATWVEQLRDLVQAAAEEAGGNKVVLRVVSG